MTSETAGQSPSPGGAFAPERAAPVPPPAMTAAAPVPRHPRHPRDRRARSWFTVGFSVTSGGVLAYSLADEILRISEVLILLLLLLYLVYLHHQQFKRMILYLIVVHYVIMIQTV